MSATPTRRPESVVAGAVAVTVVLAVAKTAVGFATGSLAVLSQALDSMLDLVWLGMVLVAVRIARKPADRSHHFGHAKAENLVAFAETLLLSVALAAIVVEAWKRLLDSPAVPESTWAAFAVLALSALVDAVRGAVLLRVAKAERSQALEAGALHVAGDVGSAVLAMASITAAARGIEWADAVGAVAIALVVGTAAVRVARRAVDVLMDRAPQETVGKIEAAAAGTPGVAEARRVRVRGDQGRLFADVTVAAGRTTSLERAHDIAEAVEYEIDQVAPGIDVVVHVEPVSETNGLVERVQAAASRIEGVREVHNVLVHAVESPGRGNLHVTFHAKVAGDLSIAQAHALSEDLEASVRDELGPDTRVDSHIEPLEPARAAVDVTRSRSDVADDVRRAALMEAEVLDCHEVLVTSAQGRLAVVAHVHARDDLPLQDMHDASQRIEQRVHLAHPEVAAVVIHFEPAGA